MEKFNDHTFVICAYKESEYLKECIQSLKKQTVKSNIIMVTSTPNEYVKNLAKENEIELYINEGEHGIGPDWNFGVSCTNTTLVTIAHQDDVYNENYLEEILKKYEENKNCSIIFGNYRELKNGVVIPLTKNLKIKSFCLRGLIKHPDSKRAKLRALKYGNAICCPCVTLNTKKLGKQPYVAGMSSNLDWYTWFKSSKLPYAFLYINKELMCHRIHEESTTSNLLENNIRFEEDYKMLCCFWPKFIARFLMHFYKDAAKTNG